MSESKRGERSLSVSDRVRLRNRERARTLRADQTDAEAMLWSRLRDRRIAPRQIPPPAVDGTLHRRFLLRRAALNRRS
ncbi:MAG: DUF559 domain-containing protein [Candidatus Binataceae bacterium]